MLGKNIVIHNKEYKNNLEQLFLSVNKPTRYSGGEYNTPIMNIEHKLKMVMCFPDIYEIGMSNLGIKILYHMLNDMEKVVCHRCFMPDIDFINILTHKNIPLFSIEDKEPIIEADIIGFSVQFEMLYTNIALMLKLANIPIFSCERDDSYPLIIAGGPCMVNPEPIADFIDLIIIGEGEESLKELAELYIYCKENNIEKNAFLKKAQSIEGVYVPAFHAPYKANNFLVIKDTGIKKAIVNDLENAYFPIKSIVSNMEIVHDRGVVELYRGCANGCRFCQAGFYYRPIRSRSADTVYKLCTHLIENTGYDEISLSSLSTSDYKYFDELLPQLSVYASENKVNLSLPSLRLDSYNSFMSENSRRSSLTFAPEAGTERLRKVINKNISDEDIEKSLIMAFNQGYSSVKLYFMIGLPTETMEDLNGIIEIVKKTRSLYNEHKTAGSALRVSVSAAVFIPKPLTPFQYERQISLEEMYEKQNYLREQFKRLKYASFSYHDANSSIIEAALARGDRQLGRVILRAYELGARFDSWTEHFKYDIWMQAFKDVGVDINNYTGQLDHNMPMPWDFIDSSISRDFLLLERNKAYKQANTDSCIKGCNACGANAYADCELLG